MALADTTVGAILLPSNAPQSRGCTLPSRKRRRSCGYVHDVRDQLYYFDADRRLVSSALLRDSTSAGSGLVYHETGESRYDPLGRRVFSRLVRGNSCLSKNASSGCRSTRTIWDGDQILGEIRVPGDTGNASLESDTPDPSDGAVGVIGYVHAPGALAIDQPAALHRSGDVVIPIADARGAFYDAWCPGTASNCGSLVPLPATGAFGTTAGDPDSLAWYGSLLWAQRDPGTGLQYRRNRHYDPASGRFIQADPIGLVGGLNVYGFAAGDPINYSDPFGLCPFTGDPRPCPDVFGDWTAAHGRPYLSRFGTWVANQLGRTGGAVYELAAQPVDAVLDWTNDVATDISGMANSPVDVAGAEGETEARGGGKRQREIPDRRKPHKTEPSPSKREKHEDTRAPNRDKKRQHDTWRQNPNKRIIE